jgi:hypothetical protein
MIPGVNPDGMLYGKPDSTFPDHAPMPDTSTRVGADRRSVAPSSNCATQIITLIAAGAWGATHNYFGRERDAG